MDHEKAKRDREQKRRLEEAKRKWVEELEAEPKVKCTIRNHDFINSGVPIEFTYKRIKTYRFKDGETVELPISVYEHINKRSRVRNPYAELDAETGQLKLYPNHTRARFTATLEEGAIGDLMRRAFRPETGGKK